MNRLAVLLAAGGGTRFLGPTHKLLADLDGQPVWQRSLHHLVTAGFERVLLVTGAVDLAVPTSLGPTVTQVHNPRWAAGQASSVQVAIHEARRMGARAVTIGLADQPFVPAPTWRAIADAPAQHAIVVAVYEGRLGPHPVRLSADTWPLLPTTGDAGARDLLRQRPEWVYRVDCIGSVADIDTVEDLAQWRSC